MKIVADETVCGFGDDDASGIGGLQHPGRDIGRVADRRVVHPPVAADADDDNETGAEALPAPELDTAAPLQFVPIALEGALDTERGMHRAPRMILMSDRRPEQRHDAVAEELIDGALVAMDFGQHQLEGTSHESVHVLRIQPIGHRGESRHVDKEHGDLLALAFESALRSEDLLGEMLRGVGRWKGRTSRGWAGGAYGLATLEAEPGARRQFRATRAAHQREAGSAAEAESGVRRGVLLALGTLHSQPPSSRRVRRE